MNLKRPDLKLPKLGRGKINASGVQAPGFLADVYYDLRDRRLLPLVALVAVAILAVPFLLGSDPEEPVLPPPPAASGGAAGGAAGGAELTVVEAKPGLRDYHERLGDRTPTDPFAQKFTAPPPSSQLKSVGDEGGSGGSGGETAGSGGEGESGSEGETGGSEGGSGGKPGGGGGGGGGEAPRLYEFVINVQISRAETTEDGKQEMSEPKVRRNVRPLTPLPGKKAPVVTTAGINLHNGKVLFVVADEVVSLEGEFNCVAREEGRLCELLEVEPGFPIDLLRGPNEVRHRIKVTKIGIVRAGRVGDKRSSLSSLGASVNEAMALNSL